MLRGCCQILLLILHEFWWQVYVFESIRCFHLLIQIIVQMALTRNLQSWPFVKRFQLCLALMHDKFMQLIDAACWAVLAPRVAVMRSTRLCQRSHRLVGWQVLLYYSIVRSNYSWVLNLVFQVRNIIFCISGRLRTRDWDSSRRKS